TGHKYEGVRFEKGNCGVSIMRSGTHITQLHQCECRANRLGMAALGRMAEIKTGYKFNYMNFAMGKDPKSKPLNPVPLSALPGTGNTVIEAVKVLVEHGVQPSVIILLSLFSTPHGAKSIIQEFPEITILTTEVHPVAPTHFGQKYFGTD
ncbi:UPP phosphoribosyltransferase, partial [Leiothrix lutea]|nr:UPP phosphoribosyltransferase [Leiothrix lutea]